jgi:hypothetical protein
MFFSQPFLNFILLLMKFVSKITILMKKKTVTLLFEVKKVQKMVREKSRLINPASHLRNAF